jgi:hypothetical protein
MLREMERLKPIRPTSPELMQTLVILGYHNLTAELCDLNDRRRCLQLRHDASADTYDPPPKMRGAG